MRPAFALVLGLAAAWFSSAASAQEHFSVARPAGEPTREQLSEARDLFLRGTEDAEAGRWADALDAFRRAYELSGIAAALYNAATTLRSVGRYRDARDAFDQLTREHPDLEDEMANSARDLRREVAARVAVLEVRDLPVDPDLRLRLDGVMVTDTTARPLELHIDSGSHTLRVERDRYEAFLWEGRIDDGARRVIDVVLVELPEVETRNVGRIVLYSVIAIVVAGAAVTLGLLLREEGLQPESDNVVNL